MSKRKLVKPLHPFTITLAKQNAALSFMWNSSHERCGDAARAMWNDRERKVFWTELNKLRATKNLPPFKPIR